MLMVVELFTHLPHKRLQGALFPPLLRDVAPVSDITSVHTMPVCDSCLVPMTCIAVHTEGARKFPRRAVECTSGRRSWDKKYFMYIAF